MLPAGSSSWSRLTALRLLTLAAVIGTGVLGLRAHEVELERALAIDEVTLLGRQIAAQAQSLVLAARARGERDPVGSVVAVLGQGFEPRAFRVRRQFPPDLDTPIELDERQGVARYWASLSEPERAPGLDPEFEAKRMAETGGVSPPATASQSRVWIVIEQPFAPRHFLGTRTRLRGDLLALALTLGLLALGGLLTRAMERAREALPRSQPEPVAPIGLAVAADAVASAGVAAEAESLRARVSAWTRESKVVLVQMGSQIREVLKHASLIVSASVSSQRALKQVSERLGAQGRAAHALQSLSQHLHAHAGDLETQALNLVLVLRSDEFANIAELDPFAENLHRLHQAAQSLRKAAERAREESTLLGETQTPLREELESAFSVLSEVVSASESLHGSVQGATRGLVDQARLIQDVNSAAHATTATDRIAA